MLKLNDPLLDFGLPAEELKSAKKANRLKKTLAKAYRQARLKKVVEHVQQTLKAVKKGQYRKSHSLKAHSMPHSGLKNPRKLKGVGLKHLTAQEKRHLEAFKQGLSFLTEK